MIAANLSYWERETFFKNIDIAIIGSGIVGLNAALALRQKDAGLRIVVFERGPLPIGASTRNAGFACFGSLSELIDDLEDQSEEEVLALVEKRWKGLQRLRSIVGEQNMDYQEYGGYEIFQKTDVQRYEKCMDHISHLNQRLQAITGLPSTYQVKDDQIHKNGFKGVEHLIWNQAEGQVHTGKMMKTLLDLAKANNITILNGITITDFEDCPNGVTLQTENGWIIPCEKMLIATNGFTKKLIPSIKVEAARNQVLITQPVKGLKIKGCFHYDSGYVYFRNIEERILLGGGRNLDAEKEGTDRFGTTELIQKALLDLLEKVILPGQHVEIDQWWSGILGVGGHKKPLVERISDRVVIAVRMGGMGVAIGSLIGREGAELVC